MVLHRALLPARRIITCNYQQHVATLCSAMLASSSEYGGHQIGCLRPKRGEARNVLRPPSLEANRGHRARGAR